MALNLMKWPRGSNGNKKIAMRLIGYKEYVVMDLIENHSNYNSNISLRRRTSPYTLPTQYPIHTLDSRILFLIFIKKIINVFNRQNYVKV